MQPVLEELIALARQKAAEREVVIGREPKLEPLGFKESQEQKSLLTGETSPKTAYIESQKRKAEAYNRTPGKLDGYDCPECKNRGSFFTVDENGYLISTPCKCMTIRNNRRRVEQSGLSDLLSRGATDISCTDAGLEDIFLDHYSGEARAGHGPSGASSSTREQAGDQR